MAVRRIFSKRNYQLILKNSFNPLVLTPRRSVMNLIDNDIPRGYFFTANSGDGTTSNGKHTTIKDTLADLKLQLARDMGVDHAFKPVLTNRLQLADNLPKSQEELPKRSMQDSYIAAVIPLANNVGLQEKYTTFLGSVRLGRLLEDMDIFAVIVARKHIYNPKLPKDALFPQTLVTVLVDRIDFTDYQPKPNKDIKISGHVSWCGRSTLEVVVWLEQFEDGEWQRITRALFLLAARDPTNSYATPVNAIEPANERERHILSGGEQRKKRRLDIDTTLVTKKIPSDEEQKIIHGIYTKMADPNNVAGVVHSLPYGSVWMKDSCISNVVLAQPEDRNLHNTVFGGFIMRHATELSWILGYMHCKYRPRTKHVSDISFKQPIAVNSLIRMHASVVFSYKNYIQNLVVVEVYNPVTGKSSTTNSFHLTLEAPDIVPEVVPVTYHEAMLYVDGRRRFFNSISNIPITGKIKPKL
ncbi:acyl-coenzyme A thioesterase 10, mitochondrial-like [Rhynchophorus ferrugineus]|uniref:HotDog ACOT-type domain-containing protein n=1 Tax=Rhynchophorus ferrugineus TaxID=354439 RepID=A0A834M5U8_RHYFE|nr:hypothetical protein GWI33_018878 [Rhynchophorus ferrugineus]